MGGMASSDAHLARRHVGRAYTAIMSFICELDMADWLGSRAEPKYLCCTSSVVTPGPNKRLVLDTRAHTYVRELTCALPQTTSSALPVPVKNEHSAGRLRLWFLLWVLSLWRVEVSLQDAWKGKYDGTSRTHTHTHRQAHTAELTLSCKRDDTLLNPRGGVLSPTVIYSLFVPASTPWTSLLVSWGAYRWKATVCSICKFSRGHCICTLNVFTNHADYKVAKSLSAVFLWCWLYLTVKQNGPIV